MKHADISAHEQMMKFMLGKWISKPIYTAAELKIADFLADGPKSIEQLASLSQSHAPSLYRLLRALASIGIFKENSQGEFDLTPMAQCLTTGSLRPIILMMHSHWHDKVWDNLLDSVKTGHSAFEKVHGMPAYAYFQNNPHAAEIFNEANAIKAATAHRTIVEAYDFSQAGTITDIGGGTGALMVEILKKNPSLKGIVTDLAHTVPSAKSYIVKQNLQSRCEVIACDFFHEIPSGSDLYLMSHVIHNWQDVDCRTILKNCHKAMTSGGTLLIIEHLIAQGNEPSIVKLLDLEVFLMGKGKERTETEFRELLESTGFVLNKILPAAGGVSLIQASVKGEK
ncbi:MAG: methyltransferase [Desulfobacteraceae bacterium]|nr:methyltransferase [Desulfobacteraceae bacterium]